MVKQGHIKNNKGETNKKKNCVDEDRKRQTQTLIGRRCALIHRPSKVLPIALCG